MSISWAAAKSAIGSDSALATYGYNGYKELYGANSGKLDFKVYWRIGGWSSTNDTFDVTVYVFGRKANSASSTNGIKITYYGWGNTYTGSKKTVTLNKSSGSVTYLGSHTFENLSTDRTSSDSDIGFKLVADSGTTDFSGTWTCTMSCNFSTSGMSSSIGTKSTTSLSLKMSNLVIDRGFSNFGNWNYKKSSASSYTTDYRSNIGYDSTVTSLSHTFDGLTPCTQYDVRFHLGMRNYNPDTEESRYVLTFKNKYWTKTAYTNAKVATEPDITRSFTYNGSSKDCCTSAGIGVSLGGTRNATNVGTYTLTATPTTEYNWTSTGVAQSSKTTNSYEWRIVAKSLVASDISTSIPSSSYRYTGQAIIPTVTVKDGNRNVNLVKDTDYTISYSNNTNPGTATVTITGIGNYTGTKRLSFTISPIMYYGTAAVGKVMYGDTEIKHIYYGDTLIF